MKRDLRNVVVSVALVGFLVSGCASSAAPVGEVTSSTTQGIQVDDGLLTIDVTIQRILLDPGGALSDDEIIQSATSGGMSAVINPAG